MLLLIIYVLIALVFSFLCSVAEAVILSVTPAHISLLEKDGKPSGARLKAQTEHIDKPLSAILTLNTIAHTMGAAGAGAQAAIVFGDAYLGVISAVLTLLILVFSEIIPKTLGASYWKALAPITAHFLHYLTLLLAPFVWMASWITKGMKPEGEFQGMSRKEFEAISHLSEQEGQLAAMEANVLRNLLSFHAMKISDAMTHRTVVTSIPENLSVKNFFLKYQGCHYSRIPIYEQQDSEKVTGYVLRNDLLVAQARGNGSKIMSDYVKPMVSLLPDLPLLSALPHFENRVHMLFVLDEYGGLAGILTMEDLLESILGWDIVDENDKHISMKKLARKLSRQRYTESKKAESDIPND